MKADKEHLVGYAIVSMMNSTQTLLVDLLPNQGSSVTACVRLLSLVGLVFC